MRAIVTMLAALLAAGRAAGQEGAPEKAQVLVLATYPFHSPGADEARFTVPDHLSAPREREIEAVVDARARFRPTTILLVERTPETGDRLAATYARYRAGSFALTANEAHHVGFRLAARPVHDAVYPVDHRARLPMDSTLAYARENDPRFVARFDALVRRVEGTMDRCQRENTVGQTLREMNSAAMLRTALEPYLELAAVGAGDGHVGARTASAWYARNLHIFGNILRVIHPGDRVLPIIGQGQAPLIDHCLRLHPEMEVVDPPAYLP